MGDSRIDDLLDSIGGSEDGRSRVDRLLDDVPLGLTSQLGALGQSIVPGALNLAAGASRGVGAAQELGASGLGALGLEGAEQHFRGEAIKSRAVGGEISGVAEGLGPEGQRAQESLGAQVGSGIGSFAPALFAGPLGVATSVGLNAYSQAGELYDEAKAAGASDRQAAVAFAGGLGIGGTEGLVLNRILGRVATRSGGRLGRAMREFPKAAGEEGLQEASQVLLSDVVLEFATPAEINWMRTISEEAPHAFLIGALVGGPAGAGRAAIGPSGPPGAEPGTVDSREVDGEPGGISPERPPIAAREQQQRLQEIRAREEEAPPEARTGLQEQRERVEALEPAPIDQADQVNLEDPRSVAIARGRLEDEIAALEAGVIEPDPDTTPEESIQTRQEALSALPEVEAPQDVSEPKSQEEAVEALLAGRQLDLETLSLFPGAIGEAARRPRKEPAADVATVAAQEEVAQQAQAAAPETRPVGETQDRPDKATVPQAKKAIRKRRKKTTGKRPKGFTPAPVEVLREQVRLLRERKARAFGAVPVGVEAQIAGLEELIRQAETPTQSDLAEAPIPSQSVSAPTAAAAAAAAPEGTQFLFSGALPSIPLPGGKAVKAFAQKNITSRGDLPAPVFTRKIEKDGWTNSQLQEQAFLVADFRRGLKAAYGTTKVSAEVAQQIDEAFKDPALVAALPEAMHEPVAAMREHVRQMSRRMIELGVVEGELAARVAENLDFYATRSYQAFDDPNWSKKVPADVRSKAKDFFREEYENLTDDEIEAKIEAMLYAAEQSGSPMALLSGRSKLGAKDLSILKRRKDIAPEIRQLLGEYKEADINYARSVMKMSHLIANHHFLTDVRQEGLGEFFFEKATKKGDVFFKEKIAAEGSDVMAPLNGLYTTPEIAQAFRDHMDQKAPESAWLRWYMKANGSVKVTKTILSLMTQVRNAVGNVGFAVAQGHWRVGKAKQSFAAVMTKLASMPSAEYRAYYLNALEKGVIHESARAGELRDLLRDAAGRDIVDYADGNVGKLWKRIFGKGLKLSTEIYQASDDVWKLYAWENEKARYRKADTGMTEEELEDFTAEIVRNTYPTYSLVPLAIKALRKFPVVGTFVSFSSEVMRTSIRTLNQIKTELKSANPKIRAIGRTRLAGTIAASTASTAAAISARFLLGMSRDDDEDARQFMPPWSENSEIIWTGNDPKGRQWIDISYTDPYSYLKKPLMALLRGEGFEGKVYETGVELLEPFIGEEILIGKLIDVRRNTTGTGGRVYNPSAPLDDRILDIVGHVWEAFEPGTLSSLQRISQGLSGKVTPYGRAYDPVIESMAMMTGVRMNVLDVEQALQFQARGYQRRLSDASRLQNQVERRRGSVSQEELDDAYRDAEAIRRDAFDDMRRSINAAKSLGISRRSINVAIDPSLSEDSISNLFRGRYRPKERPRRSRRTARR